MSVWYFYFGPDCYIGSLKSINLIMRDWQLLPTFSSKAEESDWDISASSGDMLLNRNESACDA